MLLIRTHGGFEGSLGTARFLFQQLNNSDATDGLARYNTESGRNSMNLELELREIIRLFNQERIDYALCGGMAVAIHGHPRFTKDIDLLVTQESLGNAKAAAREGRLYRRICTRTFS